MISAERPSRSLRPPVAALVVGPGHADQTEGGPLAQARLFGFDVERIEQFRLYHLEGDLSADDLDRLAGALLTEPVGQWWSTAEEHLAAVAPGPGRRVVEVGLRPGVTDREGAELVRASRELGFDVQAASVARRLVVTGRLTDAGLAALASGVLHNEVVERWAEGLLEPAFTDPEAKSPGTDRLAVRRAADDELMAVSRSRRLGLALPEMRAVAEQFRHLEREPTDAELETIAQTWSEHCSHKTFRARITFDDPAMAPVEGLLNTYLRAATDRIAAPWVRSAFVDNAGIVAFDDHHDLAIKVETHNHPSALEPFGGANTGVGGVVRDILGVSARPVAVTDVLCFGPLDLDPAEVPAGVLHPRRIRSGVVAGVGDYGNKIGVPTVAGAIVHDPSYTTTPLVFAGCVGLLPHGSHRTRPRSGDAVVVLGGAVGRDGVGGATFSSQSMGAETADIAGSSVQIGDPLIEKGLIDVVVAARDAGLYNAITDCGAGGLSSAVGEMAEGLGAEVDLALVPRKYPGLAPWEVWLSEAQERMVLACPDPAAVLALAARWQVGADVIGRFTGDGRLVVRDGDDVVVDLDIGFLHEGRPPLELRAAVLAPARPPRRAAAADPAAALLALLAHPSIRSNEAVVRTFDHEVLGGTVIRPYGGVAGDAPADGTVLVPPGTPGPRGYAIGVGVNVVLGRYDTEAMAWATVDEAVRNAVASGADPAQLSLLDNFSWGNPTDPTTLAQLVAACRGCHDAALAYGAPFVSGKDSLYNEFVGPDGRPDPVTPTLVITALGLVPDVELAPVTGVTAPGHDVWLVGPLAGALGGSHLDDALGADHGGPVPAPDPQAPARHRAVHAAITAGVVRSAHDLAEGGLAVAAAEWALGGRLGLRLLDAEPTAAEVGHEVLFGEGPARYLLEVAPADRARLIELIPDATRIGVIAADPVVSIGGGALHVGLDAIRTAYVHPGGDLTATGPAAPTTPAGGPR
ncbi:MAG: phosphoribosylformylglycinamidine synthase subunit PurL [Acidimicrobiia bacterium]|nr:phosphoribosylformylglycinamidine synthase subunit PurL [Acidimicrobiia bacterium]